MSDIIIQNINNRKSPGKYIRNNQRCLLAVCVTNIKILSRPLSFCKSFRQKTGSENSTVSILNTNVPLVEKSS